MNRSKSGTNILKSIDWWTIILYLLLVCFGWLNIYGADYDFDQTSIFDPSNRAGKQFIWMIISLVIGFLIMLIDDKIFDIFAYIFYAAWIVLLLITPFLADNTKGSYSWIQFGGFRFQPAELAKCFTALALAKCMSQYGYNIHKTRDIIITAAILLVPMAIIMLPQRETGSALVFMAFIFVLYREGLSKYVPLLFVAAIYFFVITIKYSHAELPWGEGIVGFFVDCLSILLIEAYFLFTKTHLKKHAWILIGGSIILYGIAILINLFVGINFDIAFAIIICISVVYLIITTLYYRIKPIIMLAICAAGILLYSFGCNYIFSDILQPHQQKRIEVLLGLDDDLSGAGYNVNQAQIAIGSGRFLGKGYLQGTQTKMKFVPEQATDFIFCTVGEEWGFIGSAAVLLVYLAFILRLIYLAERQKSKFSHIYAYCVASIFIAHLAINVGMVLGLMPVIGIPLPFFSYGGSSLLGFSILLFILLKQDAARIYKM